MRTTVSVRGSGDAVLSSMVTMRAAQLLDVGRVRLLGRACRCGHHRHLGQAALRRLTAEYVLANPRGLALDRAKRHGHGRQADLAMRLRVEGVGDGTVQPTGNEVLRRGAFITRLSEP